MRHSARAIVTISQNGSCLVMRLNHSARSTSGSRAACHVMAIPLRGNAHDPRSPRIPPPSFVVREASGVYREASPSEDEG